ncbi:hypothetical protein [Nocardia sp. NPDC052112]|uniref:hypothetical protein n=1 Tax=Nocardia sp. NPDC052112 TaxID=3155646 RepID=UPI0034388729
MGRNVFSAFSGIATVGAVIILAAVPLLYILSMTAVFARDRERREAARRVLAMLWPYRRPNDFQEIDPPDRE